MVLIFSVTVIVLYDVDKAADNIQHLIKWILDCYTDACRLILCCEDDSEIVESVKDQCKVIAVNAPITHEVSIIKIVEFPYCNTCSTARVSNMTSILSSI